LIQLARQSPGAIQFASSGIGQSHHLSGELFKKMAGVDIVHVPYKGSGPAAADLIGGHVQMMFANIPAALPLIEAGRARALAITGKTRSASLPNLPTVDEAGVPGYSVVSFVGLFAPVATPKPIIDKLTEEVNKAFATAEGQKLLHSMNIDWSSGSPDDFRAFLRTETAKWATLIKEANIRME
jgi:tripartite-type tricarboxylate transporter receptor subunit TctC